MSPTLPTDTSPCPCGRDAAFATCCAPYLRGHAVPSTAEALMRSRYSAYVLRDARYLLSTWDPAQRPRSLDLNRDRTEWLGLRIVETVDGGPDDLQGTVEFVARFRSQGQSQTLHERSRFVRSEGAWLYVDGEVRDSSVGRTQPAVRSAVPGRNDACPCGSGQKYKRCCGR